MTVYPDNKLIAETLRMGADDYLLKTVDREVFLEKVSRLISKSALPEEKGICELTINIEQDLSYEFNGVYTTRSAPLKINLNRQEYNREIAYFGNIIYEYHDIWLEARRNSGELEVYDYKNKRNQWLEEARRKGQDFHKIVFENRSLIQQIGIVLGLLNREDERLLLKFGGPAENLAFPFELLHDNLEELPLSIRHPIARYINNASNSHVSWTKFLKAHSGKEIKILLLSGDELMLDEINEVAEKIRTVFEKLNISVNFEPSLLKSPTTKEQALQLLEKKHFHLIHYAGHAVFDHESPDQSHLILLNEKGIEDKINAIKLYNLLKSSATNFLFLSCCSGAEIGFKAKTDSYYLGLLHASVKAGVPNALGYRWPVVGRSAKVFATHFYDGMLRFPNSLEKAAWYARQKIFYSSSNNKWDETWFSPILVTQNSNITGDRND